MKAKFHRVFIGLIITLSAVHIGAASVIFNEIKPSLAWFIGVGLMGVFLAFLNIIAARLPEDCMATRLCFAANVLAVIFAFGNLVTDRDPTTMVAILFFLGLAVTAPFPAQGREAAP